MHQFRQWRKSSYSMGNGGNCIEVATSDHRVYVRDSKRRPGPELGFGRGSWRAMVQAVKAGTF